MQEEQAVNIANSTMNETKFLSDSLDINESNVLRSETIPK